MKRKSKGAKFLTVLLCQCLVFGMCTMNVSAAQVPDNNLTYPSMLEEIAVGNWMGTNNGTVTTNWGQIYTNNGEVTTNSGRILNNNDGATVTTNEGNIDYNLSGAKVINNHYNLGTNEGNVENNFGAITTNANILKNNFGTIVENAGTVVNNYGAIGITYGFATVTHQYIQVILNGTNADQCASKLQSANGKYWVELDQTTNSATIILVANAGYSFAEAPTVDGAELTKEGNSYKLSGVSVATTINVNLVANPPAPVQKTMESTNYIPTVLKSWEAVNKALEVLVMTDLTAGENSVGTAPLLKINLANTDKVIAKATMDAIKNQNKGLHLYLGDGFALTMVGTNMVKDNADMNAEYTMSDTVNNGKKDRIIDFTHKGDLTMSVILHAYLPEAVAGEKATIYVENADETRTQIAEVTISDLNRICFSINKLQKYVIEY